MLASGSQTSPAEPPKKELHIHLIWVGRECCFPLLNNKWSCNTANLHHGLAGRLLLCSSLLLQSQQIYSILIVTCGIGERNKYVSIIPYSRPSLQPCDLPSSARNSYNLGHTSKLVDDVTAEAGHTYADATIPPQLKLHYRALCPYRLFIYALFFLNAHPQHYNIIRT